MKGLIVKKFGGTSVGSIEKISSYSRSPVKRLERGERPVVVISAMFGQTSSLIEMAHKIHPMGSKKRRGL